VDAREKVLNLRRWLLSQQPADEEVAQQAQVLSAISPLLVRALPDDPAEVDRLLRLISWGAAQCRSDDAPALGLFELVDGEWRRVELEPA
jgi:hypothetical protein